MRFLSTDHARANSERLARAAAEIDYSRAVEKLRRVPVGDKACLSVHFDADPVHRAVVSTGVFDEVFQDTYALDAGEKDTVYSLVEAALHLLSDIDEKLATLVSLVVTDVVVIPSSTRTGGGSASHMPGVVAVSPKSSWTATEMAETLVHEATHLNIFLSEMLHKLYSKPLAQLERPEHRALSAVRIGEMRPLDKAFHSALVAVPLLYMQHITGAESLATLFSDSLRDSCDGVVAQRDCFTGYGWAMVQDLARYTDSFHPSRGFDNQLVKDGLRASDRECLVTVDGES